MQLDGVRVRVQASIGIVLCDEPSADPYGLLRHADAAMYLAKRDSGGARSMFFEEAVGSSQAAHPLVVRRHHLDRPAS